MFRAAVAALLIACRALVPAASARPLDAPVAHASATCADYPNQAAAQRAADTRDADGDGIYCESLPCPCLKPGEGDGGADPAPAPDPKPSCRRPKGVQSIAFSKAKYANIRKHALQAIRDGWPSVLVINRPGADARRDRLLEDVPTRDGYDRDEYPPAVGRGRGKGLVRGSHPRGWMADVAYDPSAENRSHGSSLGGKLRRFCDGTRFRTSSAKARSALASTMRAMPGKGAVITAYTADLGRGVTRARVRAAPG